MTWDATRYAALDALLQKGYSQRQAAVAMGLTKNTVAGALDRRKDPEKYKARDKARDRSGYLWPKQRMAKKRQPQPKPRPVLPVRHYKDMRPL